MRFSSFIVSSLIVVAAAGCMKKEEPEFAMRNATGAVAEHAVMQEQAAALSKMTQDVVRKSTLNGAALGAIAGCGLVVLNAANAQNCVAGALAGGLAGAAIGNASGHKQVEKRMQLVSPSDLVRTIGKSTDQVAQIEMSLPSLLAAQDIELAEMTQKLKQGEITEADYAAKADKIRQDRAELAQTLSLSAAQAQTAHNNLKDAAAQGQTGLDWHINATGFLAKDVMSARDTIDLL